MKHRRTSSIAFLFTALQFTAAALKLMRREAASAPEAATEKAA